jgi:hypothetical protein
MNGKDKDSGTQSNLASDLKWVVAPIYYHGVTQTYPQSEMLLEEVNG